MYKKGKIVWFVALCFLCGLFVNYWYGASWTTYTEDDMNNVWVRFCNEGTGEQQLKKDVSLSLEPWKENNLCIYFFNVGDKPMEFVYGFSQGKIGKQGEKMCEWDMTTGNSFSKLIPFTNERSVTVEAKSYKTVTENIKIPLGMSGAIYGCIAYKLAVPQYAGVWWMFTLVVRRTAHIDFFVWGEGVIKNNIKINELTWGVFTTNKKIKAEVDENNRLKVSFLVKNDGNIAQNVSVTWEVSNILWFNKIFNINTKQLTPGEKYTFTADLGIIPFYKWLFAATFTVNNTPVFDFDASGIAEKYKQSWTITETANIFMFTRVVVAILLVVLFLLYRVFVPRKKIVVVQ